jgi:hypothetical protein
MAQNEDQLLKGAIDATQKEIFADVFDNDEAVLDETGDRSIEEMGDGLEGQVEEDEAGDEAEDAGKGVDAKDDAETKDDKAAGDKDPNDKTARDDKGKFTTKDEKAEPEKGTQPDPKAGKDHRVPVGELKSERSQRQAAEERATKAEERAAAAEAKAQDEVAKLNAKLDGVLAAQRQPPQPAKTEEAKTPERPDMFADPEGYAKWVEDRANERVATVERNISQRFIEQSFALAHDAHKEVFEKAHAELTSLNPKNPADVITVRNIANAPNPGAALMKWHRNRETLREVGPDPAAFKQKLADDTRAALMKDPEFRKQLLEDLRAEATGGANSGDPARTITRLPKSLNGAAGSGSNQDAVFDGSQRAIFDNVFADQ